jgi:prepilin-type N-terminal cleavage/methylation domain-containing protein
MRAERTTRFGFTLAELLIAVAITSLIVVMLGAMFGSLASTVGRASQRIDAFRDARAAVATIQRDLSNLVRVGPAAYFALDDRYTNDPNTTANKNRQLFALIAIKNGSLGDLCAVGYYCRWEGNRYTLRRYFRNSNELSADNAYFTNLGRAWPPWNFISNGAGNYMRSDKLYQPSDVDAPSSDPPSFKDETLAAYVWNLQIKAYKSDGKIDTAYPLIMDPSLPTALPAAIEISFKTISPEAAKTIMAISSNPNDWMDETSSAYIRLIKPHAYEFRTRVNF